jgi:uncharacterized repeat protein (TIGR03803 family)
VSIGAVATLLSACGGAQPPLSASPAGIAPQRALAREAYQMLHSFGASGDGTNPVAGLVDVKGTLYGTTATGGANNGGTVFAVAKTGEETVLHSFGSSGDGGQPEAGLIDVKGTLYGTTEYGGAHGGGTVFSITTAGKEKIVYSFGFSGTDGVAPFAGLLDVNGTLYGTTQQGGVGYCGSATCGTVFSVTTRGAEKVLYSFGQQADDGMYPVAGLIDVKGRLYGTTEYGGAGGCGTVFSVTMGGTQEVLHSFSCGKDGSEPMAGLIDVTGTLYGTTEAGGEHYGGTVFTITTAGIENVAYSFSGSDGSGPVAGLIDVKGTLYGTTSQGGAYNDGAVFSLTTSGKESVLHSFAEGTNGRAFDGADPEAGLIEVSGTLYGTTSKGGAYGDGIVFSLRP